MLQKGKSVLWRASFEGHIEIVLLLLHHHAAVDLPNDVRHSNTMYTIDIDACTYHSHYYPGEKDRANTRLARALVGTMRIYIRGNRSMSGHAQTRRCKRFKN